MKRFKARQTYLLFILIMSVFLITGCGGGDTVGQGEDLAGNWLAPDTTAPTVTDTSPANNDTGVAITRAVIANFSEKMDESTITETTFTLKQGITPVSGSVDYSGITAVFTPDIDLANGTTYIATITTGATDLAGNALATDYEWIFETGVAPDTTKPRVIFTVPATTIPLTTGVPTNITAITATFSEAMNPLTIPTAFTVRDPGGVLVAGGAILGAPTNIATFTPEIDLKPNTTYTATITTGAEDLAGNQLAGNQLPLPAASNYIWSFTTGASPDNTAPWVTLTVPANAATGVAITSAVNATFSEAMAPLTINTETFTVKGSGPPLGTPLEGRLAYDIQNHIATFIPKYNLTPDTEYTATITTGATDVADNPLDLSAVGAAPNPWTFRTAAAAIVPLPLAINLRSAANFAIAARAGLTSTGVTVVNGDVALWLPSPTCTDSTGGPGGASRSCLFKTYPTDGSLTGMTVNGSIYWAGDPWDNGGTANSVTNDLQIAWTEGMNKANTQGTVGGQLSRVAPYVPGVYTDANLNFASGGVATLDALGNADAVFIFQVGTIGGTGDFTASDSGGEIKLINGAQARNVWFVVGRDATIGLGIKWIGNILAGRDVTVKAGSTVNGRVLAGGFGAGAFVLTGAATPVTTITVPAN